MIFHAQATLRHKIKNSVMLAALTAFLLTTPYVPSLAAETAAVEHPAIPQELGKVVYQKEGKQDNHVYIICQSHRNAQSGANGENTTRVQADIYRLGEWLIRNEQVELLLPEGFFNPKDEQPMQQVAFTPSAGRKSGTSFDEQTLHSMLNDTTTFYNADKLLKESYDVDLGQVEDEKLYFSILNFLYNSERKDRDLDAGEVRILDYLQEKRSAAMLQRIPGVIGQKVQEGRIARKKAILTIGMAHIDEMIRFLKEGKIEIDSPLSRAALQEELSLLRENYNVTVILPRSLAEDQKAMKIANLGEI